MGYNVDVDVNLELEAPAYVSEIQMLRLHVDFCASDQRS